VFGFIVRLVLYRPIGLLLAFLLAVSLLLLLLLTWTFSFSTTPFCPTSRNLVARLIAVRAEWITSSMLMLMSITSSICHHGNGFLVGLDSVFFFDAMFDFDRRIVVR
jgi:hypothetical protein